MIRATSRRGSRSEAGRLPIRAVVFDFDGTLVDSNEVKRRAYFQIFSRTPNAEAVVEEVLGRLQTATRFQVIDAILKGLKAPAKGRDARIAEFASRYNRICEGYASRCPEIRGASACLRRLNSRYLLFVSSATPEEPLSRIVRRRGWRRFFAGVHGWPPGKRENLGIILERASLDPAEILCVGDTRQDREDARAAGCGFVGVRNRENTVRDLGPVRIDDLATLESLILKRWG